VHFAEQGSPRNLADHLRLHEVDWLKELKRAG